MSLFDSLRWLTETGDAFANGVDAKLKRYGASVMGGPVKPPEIGDQTLRFKERLATAGVFHHEVLIRTPANVSRRWEISRRGPLGWVGVSKANMVALTAVDFEEVIARSADIEGDGPGPWSPLSAEGLSKALADFHRPPRRTFVGICSPSGFSAEALEQAHALATPLVERGGGLILVSPREDGGWKTHLLERSRQDWHFLFDPEPDAGKIERIRAAIRRSEIELVETGLSERELARRLDVPAALVHEVILDEVKKNPALRLRELDGERTLLASAELDWSNPRTESMLDKLRKLFGLRGQEEKKMEMLSDKRALLTTRRDRLYRELDELAEREAEIKKRGIEADSDVTRRRIASELGQVRRRLDQGNTLASLFNRQIDVLSTHIHHLQLVGQGEQVSLPDVEEITEDAVRAEELLERVKADSDLVESLAESTGSTLTTRQEEDIMAELTAAHEKQEAGGAEKRPAKSESADEPPVAEPVDDDEEAGPPRRMAAEE